VGKKRKPPQLKEEERQAGSQRKGNGAGRRRRKESSRAKETIRGGEVKRLRSEEKTASLMKDIESRKRGSAVSIEKTEGGGSP